MRLFSLLSKRIVGRPQHCRSRKHRSAPRFRPRLEALEDRYLPSGGVLDPTFGSGGIVSTSVGGIGNTFAVATYPAGTANAGKVVAVGMAGVTRGSSTYNEFAVARFNLNGTLDTTFGSDGTGEVTTILTTLKQGGWARDVAIQPDGKIVVVGQAFPGFALVRYNTDGSLDTSFGSNGTGIVITNSGKFTSDAAYSLGLQPDGKIVVAGTTSSTSTDLAVERYTAGGLLDTSFGKGGIVTTPFAVDFGGPLNNWVDLELDTSPLDPNAGKMVVVTRVTGGQDLVARYNSNGSLDTSFARGAGYETLSNLTLALPSVAIQSNGDLVVAGNQGAAGPMEVDRLNPNGSFDATFGSGGIVVVTPPANTFYSARDVTIQSNGQIVVAGFYGTTTQDFLVARFNSANGSLDTSFGVDGVASSGSNASGAVGLALEPDGRIVVAASQSTGVGTRDVTLARFVAYGPEVGSFTASPNPVTAGSDLTLTAGNITDEIPSAAIAQVAFYVQINGSNTLLGYGTQSSTGVWTLTFTVNLAPGTYTLYAQAEDGYGILGDLVALTLTVQ